MSKYCLGPHWGRVIHPISDALQYRTLAYRDKASVSFTWVAESKSNHSPLRYAELRLKGWHLHVTIADSKRQLKFSHIGHAYPISDGCRFSLFKALQDKSGISKWQIHVSSTCTAKNRSAALLVVSEEAIKKGRVLFSKIGRVIVTDASNVSR